MSGRVLVTGGAGFIGTNVADRLASTGHQVLVFDNLSRAGVWRNLQWLLRKHPDAIRFEYGDVRDATAVGNCVRDAAAVFHFAAQVAVTTSLVDPITDFEINARGTLNILEELRRSNSSAPLFYTSTNKVYGDLVDVELRESETRYIPTDPVVHTHGVNEDSELRFRSPYGCSKGTADQYVLDYAASYGLRAVVFRMSCIYGTHQFGTEDQGWVAHFLIRALTGEPITLYGDGRQVRDILYASDLVDAFLRAWRHVDSISGRAFNIGGGPQNTVSLIDLLQLIREYAGEAPSVEFESWRVGDQRYYVSDTRRFSQATGWRPRVHVREGVQALAKWLAKARRSVPVPAGLHASGRVHSDALHGGAA